MKSPGTSSFWISLSAVGILAFLLVFANVGLAQIAGRNVNMVSGTTLPGGDPFLQRQNEPSVAVSTRNPQHLLAGANDYRTVDLPGLPDGKVTGDAWLGVFKSFDGGESWISTLIPGYPQDNSSRGQNSPLKGFEAAADPVVRAGSNGLFYYSGIAFDRGDQAPSSVFVSLFIDNNNKENGDPIKYVRTRIIEESSGTVFIDKPWMAVDVPRAGAETALIEVPKDEDPGDTVVQEIQCGHVYVAWAEFSGNQGNGTLKSRIMLSRSTDCGNNWSNPTQLNRPAPGAGAMLAEGGTRTALARPPGSGSDLGGSRNSARGSGLTSPASAVAVAQDRFAEEIEDLEELIDQAKAKGEEAGLNRGEINSLVSKLENAIDSLERGNSDAAIGQIEAFINEMEAFVESGKIGADTGQECIDEAERIIESIRGKLDDDDGDDGGGNGGPGTELFAGELSGIEEMVEDVEQTADGAGLSEEDQEALLEQLETAEDSLVKNDPEQAVEALDAFADELEQLVAEGELTEEQATPLATAAFELISSIEVKSQAGTEQGASIAIDPGDGTVYVAWRRFGTPDEPHAMLVTRSTDGGQTFDDPATVAEIDPFEQGTSEISFRTNDFPSMTVGGDGTLYMAFSERIGSEGDARIVITTSSDGQSWSSPAPVDPHSSRGHQFMPSLTFAAGKLTVVYYDQRDDISGRFEAFIHDSVFPRHTVDVRVAQADPGPSPSFAPSARISRNQHALADDDADSGDIEQVEFDPPNYPLFRKGTVPFFSDYIDVAPAPRFVSDGGGDWSFNTGADKTLVFHAAWADNRDVREPADGDWANYTPPELSGCIVGQTGMRNQNVYTSRISQGIRIGVPGNTKPVDIQRAFVVFAENTTGDVMHVRMKILDQPPGGQASFLQFELLTEIDVSIPPHSTVARPVFVQSSDAGALVRVRVVQISGPGGGETGGFDGTVLINPDPTNPNVVNPNVVNPNVVNPNVVNAEVYNAAFVNPNVVNPNVVNPNVVNPNVVNLSFVNPNVVNPNVVNPNVVNPNVVNPNVVNPNVVNPNVVNPNVVNPNVVNPNVVNTSLEEAQWAVRNEGNTTASYSYQLISGEGVPDGIEMQLLITRVHHDPVADGCSLEERISQELLANVINPRIIDPNTEPFDPGATNLDDPAIENATFFLAPGDVAFIALRVYDPDTTDDVDFDLQSVGAVVTPHGVNTGDDEPTASVNLTIITTSLPAATDGSLYSETLEALGGTDASWSVIDGALPDGLSLDTDTGEISGTPSATGEFAFTVRVEDSGSPQQSDTQDLLITVTSSDGTSAVSITTTSLPGGVVGELYSETLEATNGTTPYSWSVITGALPDGLTLDSATGEISGEPTSAAEGTSDFTVEVTDSSSPQQSDTQDLSITVESQGPTITELKRVASDAVTGQRFGLSVSVFGDGAVVGAPGDDANGEDSGAAYVFRHQTDGSWAEEVKLTASDGAIDDVFGISVSVSGDTVLVGAFQDDDGGDKSGSVYVFRTKDEGNTWSEEAKLTASDAGAGDRFGFSVSLSGDIAVIGMNFGAAYVFRRTDDTWTEEAILTSPDAAAAERFGWRVSVSGTTAVVAAPLDDDGSTDSGSAFVFRRQSDGTWSQEAKLTASDPGAGDELGHSVSVSGDTALVGANFDDDGGIDSGSAYIFRRQSDGTWSQEAKLIASDAEAGDELGDAVGITGDTAIVGARRDDDSATDSGSAYVFRRQSDGSWVEEAKLTASDASVGDLFGDAAAISGDMALVGAPGNDADGSQTGAAYFFELTFGSLSIDTTSLPNGTVGTSYTETLQASGGNGTLSWSLIAGALPDGLDLDASTGEISGTPSATGEFAFTVRVEDSSSPQQSDTQDLLITVASSDGTSAVSITTTSLPGGVVGGSYSETLEATAGTTPYSWSVITGALPDGLTLDSATGEISGEPTSAAEGTSDFTVEVTDSSSPQQSDTQDLSITVGQPSLSFPAQPSSAVAGEPFSVEVKVENGSGDPVQGVTVTVSLGENLTGGTLSGTTSVDSDASGIAAFTDLSVDFGGIYSLVAATNPSIESDTFQVEGFFPAGGMGVPRATHASALLAPDDGRILVAGGESGSTTTATADLFDPGTQVFMATSDMVENRVEHTATLLEDGTVLVVGGVPASNSAELFDPGVSGGSFSLITDPLEDFRNQHTATLLADGRVLIAGGHDSGFARFATPSTNGSVEVYDPATASFSLVGDMIEPRASHTATRFLEPGPDGVLGTADDVEKVLVVGGRVRSDGSDVDITETAEIFDPRTGTFAATGSMSFAREEHAAVLLADGRVLVAGGVDFDAGTERFVLRVTVEIYDPVSGTFSAPIDMVRGRSALTATLLANDQVLLAGGGNDTAEIFDPADDSLRSTAPMGDSRERHTSSPFVHPGLDGTFGTGDELELVLIAGGQDFSLASPNEELDTAEVFFPIQ